MPKYAYLQGEFIPLEDANVSIMTHAFLYGTAVFEGIRAYWSDKDNQLYIFRAKEHYERLANSCRIMRMDPGHTVEEMTEITRVLLEKNEMKGNAYIRPMVYKCNHQVGVKLSGLDDDFLLLLRKWATIWISAKASGAKFPPGATYPITPFPCAASAAERTPMLR